LCIFVDDLLDELNERDERETEPLPGLMFMDDLAVIGCSTATIERSHKIIMNWCAKWEATINPTKLEILQKNKYEPTGPSNSLTNTVWTLRKQ